MSGRSECWSKGNNLDNSLTSSVRNLVKITSHQRRFNIIFVIGDFTSFSAVFQSYKDDGKLIIKGYVQWNSVYV